MSECHSIATLTVDRRSEQVTTSCQPGGASAAGDVVRALVFGAFVAGSALPADSRGGPILAPRPPIISYGVHTVAPVESILLSERAAQWRLRLQQQLDAFAKGKASILETSTDGGGVLLELATRGRRIGICLDPVDGRSSWFLASTREAGSMIASGALANLDLGALVRLSSGRHG